MSWNLILHKILNLIIKCYDIKHFLIQCRFFSTQAFLEILLPDNERGFRGSSLKWGAYEHCDHFAIIAHYNLGREMNGDANRNDLNLVLDHGRLYVIDFGHGPEHVTTASILCDPRHRPYTMVFLILSRSQYCRFRILFKTPNQR